MQLAGILTGTLDDGFLVDDQSLGQTRPVQIGRQFGEKIQTPRLDPTSHQIRLYESGLFVSTMFPESQQFFVQIMLIGFQLEEPMRFFLKVVCKAYVGRTWRHR